MRRIFVLSIICLLTANTLQQNTKVNFQCDFVLRNFQYFKNIHSCSIMNGLNVQNRGVQLENEDNLYYPDTLSLSIANKSIFYLPNDIEKFFPNLEILEVVQSGLMDISSQNLEPFPKLKFLDLSGNRIQTLQWKLFRFNSKLEVISLNDNEITTVDEFSFYGLNSLKYLGFLRNRCFSGRANEIDSTQDLIDVLKVSCSGLNISHLKSFSDMKTEVAKLNIEIYSLKASLKEVKENNKNFSVQNEQQSLGTIKSDVKLGLTFLTIFTTVAYFCNLIIICCAYKEVGPGSEKSIKKDEIEMSNMYAQVQ